MSGTFEQDDPQLNLDTQGDPLENALTQADAGLPAAQRFSKSSNALLGIVTRFAGFFGRRERLLWTGPRQGGAP